MQNRVLEFAVGLFVILGLVALAMLTFKVGGFSLGSLTNNENQSYQVFARFENIGGLTDKSPVRMAGVNIGRVTRIQLDPVDYSAKVFMDIDSENDSLPLDSSAAILTSGLIGSNYIGLEAGGDIDYLQNGDEIELTQSAIVLENLIGKFLYNSSNSENASSQ